MDQLLKKLPAYPQTDFVAVSMGEYIQADFLAPGYTIEDITIEVRENGIAVIGSPKKNIGDGMLVKGFTNFLELHDHKKFDRKATTASLFNGILTLKVPVMEEFRTVKIEVKQEVAATA